MNAPRALPTWSGPVGLADTNSTLTVRGRTFVTWPQAAGSARTAAMTDSSAASASRRFRKPGAATSAEAIGEIVPAAAAAAASLGPQFRGQDLGDRQGRHAVRARELHGEVAREIAVVRIRRALHLDGRSRRPVRYRRQRARLDRPFPGALHRSSNPGADRWLGTTGSGSGGRGFGHSEILSGRASRDGSGSDGVRAPARPIPMVLGRSQAIVARPHHFQSAEKSATERIGSVLGSH